LPNTIPSHAGLPFSRTDQGKIYQRAFGGMTQNMGEGPAATYEAQGFARFGRQLRQCDDRSFFVRDLP